MKLHRYLMWILWTLNSRCLQFKLKKPCLSEPLLEPYVSLGQHPHGRSEALSAILCSNGPIGKPTNPWTRNLAFYARANVNAPEFHQGMDTGDVLRRLNCDLWHSLLLCLELFVSLLFAAPILPGTDFHRNRTNKTTEGSYIQRAASSGCT